MVRRRGPRLTAAQKAELWHRWRQGESLTAIGRALGRIPKMVHYVVAGAGGIPPVPRQRARQALTLSEREVISRGVARGVSLRQISRDLGRAPSTVSREVRRHGGPPPVSGRGGGPAGVGARPAPEALSPRDAPRAACRGGHQARARVGAAADRRLAA